MLHIHLIDRPDEPALAELGRHLNDAARLTFGPEPPPDAHLLVGGRPTAALLDGVPELRAVVIPFTGVPDETRRLLLDRPGVALHNMRWPAASTAEMALALLLAAAKRLVPIDQALRRDDWTPRYAPVPVVTLDGRSALILGLGAIGRRVARVCAALGMRVRAVRRSAAGASAGEAEVFPPDALRDLLPQTDALIVALPLTPETRGLIGAAELALLPPRALLVNVGRGPIVDEAALYSALAGGRLGAAGLDVWYQYPKDDAGRSHTPPSQFAFGQLDNVVLSPHRGGFTPEGDLPFAVELAGMLKAALRGGPMPNRVDVRAGY